ncbi:MAG: hypothetical protein U9N52_06215, partial [Campylobacterota bacterium]|nr:hypothetical protein [Campylobacterota bacterium]
MYKSRFFMQLSVFMFSLFLLSGCGANNSQSAPSSAPDIGDGNVSTAIASLSISGGDVTVSQNDETVSIRVKALTKDDRLASTGKILAQYLETGDHEGELTPSEVEISEGFATFVYIAPKDLQNQIDSGNSGTNFKFYKEDDLSVTTTLKIIFDTTADTEGSDPISKLILSKSTISITDSLETQQISITGLKSDNTAVENGKVMIQYPSTGDIDAGSVPSEVSITNGLGSFTYTAPVDINKAATISPFQFKIYDKSNESVATLLNVNVIENVTVANMVVSNGSVTLSTDGESVSVNVLVTGENGSPINTGTVRVKYPDDAVRVGLFSTDEVLIANGIATFSYAGPESIYNGSAKFTFEYKENPTYTTQWSVYFRPEVVVIPVDPTYPIVNLTVDEDIVLNSDGETKTIQVLALMGGNAPAPEGKISVVYPPDAKTKNIGTISPAEAELSSDGIATFTYTGPTPLVLSDDQNFTFRATEYPNISDMVSVSYLPQENDPISKLILSESTITVTQPEETKLITIRGLKLDNTAVINGKVLIQYPSSGDVDVGHVPAEVSIVDGVGSFTYTAPIDLINAASISPVQFKIYDITNTAIATFLNVNFGTASSVVPRITVSPTPVSITQNSETVAVTVLATDTNGSALQSGTIMVLNPNGVTAGYFTESEVDIVNGIAVFSYVGPNPLSAGAATFTFRFKEDSSYERDWTVIFDPDVGVAPPTIGKIVVNKDIEVGISGEIQGVQVFVFSDSAGTIPATSGTVTVNYPATVSTTDVGIMSPAEAEVNANGIASFTFTAPTPL